MPLQELSSLQTGHQEWCLPLVQEQPRTLLKNTRHMKRKSLDTKTYSYPIISPSMHPNGRKPQQIVTNARRYHHGIMMKLVQPKPKQWHSSPISRDNEVSLISRYTLDLRNKNVCEQTIQLPNQKPECWRTLNARRWQDPRTSNAMWLPSQHSLPLQELSLRQMGHQEWCHPLQIRQPAMLFQQIGINRAHQPQQPWHFHTSLILSHS